jgi:hypothetical protein
MFELNRDRVSTLMSNIEKMLIELAKVTAKEFNDHEMGYMFVRAELMGRSDGDVRITFLVGESEYHKERVEGTRLMSAFQEYARRKGWEKTNKPLMISFDSSGRPKEEDHGTYVLELPSRSDPLSNPDDPLSVDDRVIDDIPF